MFSLVITLISIALVAALALATIYYGSTAYAEARSRAEASQAVNEAAQIDAATTMFSTQKGQAPHSLQELVSQSYLKTLPSGQWQVVEGQAVKVLDIEEAQCLATNKQLGVNTVPSCDDPAYTNQAVCCTVAG